MDRFELFKSRLGLSGASRRLSEKRSSQIAARNANGNRHLSSLEAETLALRTHEMLDELEPELRSRKVGRIDVCRRAFSEDQTSTRELYRVTLPPGADRVKRGLRMHLAPYRNVAIALEELTQRRRGQLVHRLVEGTSCDDLRNAAERWRDMDRLVAALERLTGSMDQEFGWTETYRRTLERRKEGARSGSRLCWPLWQLEPPSAEECDPDALKEYASALKDEADGTNAFYRPRPQYYGPGDRHTAAQYLNLGALQDAEFFYVPHAPIGHLIMWDLPQRRSNAGAYEQALARELTSIRALPQYLIRPTDDWNESAQCPSGQVDPLNYECSSLQYHVWLIVYPLPTTAGDGTLRIGPALYQAGEEGGAWIMPLSSANLAAVVDVVWVDETQTATLLDRLTELLILDDADERSLSANLRRTGHWLKHNPVLKAEQQRVQRQQQLLRIAGRLPRL